MYVGSRSRNSAHTERRYGDDALIYFVHKVQQKQTDIKYWNSTEIFTSQMRTEPYIPKEENHTFSLPSSWEGCVCLFPPKPRDMKYDLKHVFY